MQDIHNVVEHAYTMLLSMHNTFYHEIYIKLPTVMQGLHNVVNKAYTMFLSMHNTCYHEMN